VLTGSRAHFECRSLSPDRAQLIQLTPAGRAASDRICQAGTTGMQTALAHWPPQERHQLATLLHRMVDDFLAYAAEEREQPAR
jgi:DNA-binding MarR family transcriptional regulator